uniref:Uncharacterized protein n=1 Tax=Parastrongyloides trichosuri TaxID=131310 RepID=A0A0N4Z8B4_PARTI
MISKALLIVILINFISFNFPIQFVVTGTLKCNNTPVQGFTASICDGTTDTKPKATATSDNRGFFTLNTQLEDPSHTYRVSIYHNCTSNSTQDNKERIYTRQPDYQSLFTGGTTSLPRAQAPLSTIDLDKVSNSTHKACGKA